jgi:hypothetical protein
MIPFSVSNLRFLFDDLNYVVPHPRTSQIPIQHILSTFIYYTYPNKPSCPLAPAIRIRDRAYDRLPPLEWCFVATTGVPLILEAALACPSCV